jgi:hypothetical protein
MRKKFMSTVLDDLECLCQKNDCIFSGVISSHTYGHTQVGMGPQFKDRDSVLMAAKLLYDLAYDMVKQEHKDITREEITEKLKS